MNKDALDINLLLDVQDELIMVVRTRPRNQTGHKFIRLLDRKQGRERRTSIMISQPEQSVNIHPSWLCWSVSPLPDVGPDLMDKPISAYFSFFS